MQGSHGEQEDGAVERAVALVAGSALFDAEWYAEVSGRSFADRREAITDFVTTGGRHGTPHWLFADRWLFPARGWRDRATDPLSHYLDGPSRRRRAPHPLLGAVPEGIDGPLGPADAWLRKAGPDDVLPAKAGAITVAVARAASLSPAAPPTGPVAADGVTALVLPPDLPDAATYAVAWLRRLEVERLPTLVVTDDPVVWSVAASLTAAYVVAREQAADLTGEVVVVLRPNRRPGRFTDLRPLIRALDDPTVSLAQALLVADDRTVAAAGARADGTPYLAGLPVADAERASGEPVAAAWPGAVAVRAPFVDEATSSRSGTVRLVPSSLVPAAVAAGPDRAAWAVAEQPGRLRWAIDTAGPFQDPKWGDYHFARSLAEALEGLGQHVAVDHPESRARASRELDDVILVLRGLERVSTSLDRRNTPLDRRNTPLDRRNAPLDRRDTPLDRRDTPLDRREAPLDRRSTPPDRRGRATNLLWVISHPDEVDAAEVAAYDATWAAGPVWAERRGREWGLPIGTLLQATDPARFHPGLAAPDSGPELLFVGNRRHGDRPAVLDSVAAGLPLSVYGAGWDGIVDVVADHVDNAELGRLYASAGIVLNDHWPDMAAAGFVSNRVFDVLATGARLLTDEVPGLHELFPDVPVFAGRDDLVSIVRDPGAHFADAGARRALADRVVVEHSFAARAEVLLEAALRLRAR